MTETVINYDDYIEESNDPREPKECKLLGPFHPSGLRDPKTNKTLRIPYTGWTDPEGETFRLAGFGRIDKRRHTPVAFTDEELMFLDKYLGAWFKYQWPSSHELQTATKTAITTLGFDQFKQRLWELKSSLGNVQALETLVGLREAVASPPPTISRLGHDSE